MGILRFLLALSVLYEHLSLRFHLVGGSAAVQSFYIISGFYMALVLNEKYVGPRGAYRLFVGNRLLRLFPCYFVVLALSLATMGAYRAAGVARDDPLGRWLSDWPSMSLGAKAFLLVPNLTLFGLESHLFSNFDPATGGIAFSPRLLPAGARYFDVVPQAWSLSLELTFYAIAPFLVRRRVRTLLAVMAASLLVRGALAAGPHYYKDPWQYRFFPNELFFFVAGAVGYRAYDLIRRRGWRVRGWAVAALVAVLGYVFAYPYLPEWKRDAVLFPLVAASVPLVFGLTKNWKWDRYLGELSYPMYLAHILVIYVVGSIGGPPDILATVGTVVLGAALYWLVDRPVDRFRHRMSERKAMRAAAGTATPTAPATVPTSADAGPG